MAMPMPILRSAATWAAMILVVTPLAVMLLAAIPSGALAPIAMHTILLVGGAAFVLALRPAADD